MNINEILIKFNRDKENLINILHAVQNSNPENYLRNEDLKEVADFLNLTMSHVYGVVTYYTMFSLKPRAKYIIRICNSPVCDMEKSKEIIHQIKEILSIDVGETTADKKFALELSECLGRCAVAPSMMINEDVIGNLEKVNLKTVFEKYN